MRSPTDDARRSVRAGDVLYYHGPGGPAYAPVVCHGQHGVTLDIGGTHTPVRWEHVLGHRERVSYPVRIVDQGEDGAIVEEDGGEQTFIEGLAAPDPETEQEPDPTAWDTVMTKALFFFKAQGIKNRPGLHLEAETDRGGHQVHRWKRSGDVKGVKPGQGVTFQGEHGKPVQGEVTAAGQHGVTVRDERGGQHQVKHGDYRPAANAREDVPDQPQAKPQGKSAGDARRFFEPEESASLPHKDTVGQTVFDSWESAEAIAPKAHAEYQTLLNNMAQSLGFSPGRGAPDAMNDADLDSDESFVFMGPIKQQAKSTAKVDADYGGDWSKLKDLVRATIAVRSIGDVHQTLDGLKKAGLTLAQKPKDNMTHGTADGYRDLNLVLKLPETGMLVELQIAVKQISKVKGDAHAYYDANIKLDQERKRQIQRGGKSAGAMRVGEPIGGYDENNPDEERNWPDKSMFQKFIANRKKQQEIYGSAWAKVPGIELIAKALVLFMREIKRLIV